MRTATNGFVNGHWFRKMTLHGLYVVTDWDCFAKISLIIDAFSPKSRKVSES
jgi:hypothetical protein